MMDTAYYRARINAIGELLKKLPDSDEKNNERVLLRNGFIPEKLQPEYHQLSTRHHQDLVRTGNQPPLSFVEICSFNTWFAIHPEKVAGEEMVTNSREFPIMIKGTREDIMETVSAGLSDTKEQRVRIAKAQAKAKLKLFELTKLETK